MTNKQIAGVLKETASLIDLTGGNPFRSRAMANAGRVIQRLEEPVGDMLAAGTLTDVRGIGSGLADQLKQLLESGSFDVREELLNAIPPGLLDMLAVKGLGAIKVRTLWKTMGIQTLDDLEAAAESGRIAEQEGFGKKTQSSILENIAALRRYRTRRHFADAHGRMQSISAELSSLGGVSRVEVAGEMRRQMETVAGIDFVVALAQTAARADLETRFGPAETDGETGLPVIRTGMPDGFPLSIFIAPGDGFGTTLFRLSGSDVFLNAWRERFGEPGAEDSEAAIFSAAGVAPIPPELRETGDAIELAAGGTLPELIVEENLRGTLHNHSTYSDGANTLGEMARAARSMGLSYFGICDHSRSLRIANGLMPEDVARQQQEIRVLNEAFAANGGPAFQIFSGTESDILADGSLDYPDEILDSFDFVVASVHTGFNMTISQATDRVIRAVSNPHTRILGHPTGRLLLRREGYPLDHDAVLDACAEYGVAVELNANPYRLDLDWRWIRSATDRGVLISINPDAHAVDQLAYAKWGVAVARKGHLTASQCLNALPLDEFQAWTRSRSPALSSRS